MEKGENGIGFFGGNLHYKDAQIVPNPPIIRKPFITAAYRTTSAKPRRTLV